MYVPLIILILKPEYTGYMYIPVFSILLIIVCDKMLYLHVPFIISGKNVFPTLPVLNTKSALKNWCLEKKFQETFEMYFFTQIIFGMVLLCNHQIKISRKLHISPFRFVKQLLIQFLKYIKIQFVNITLEFLWTFITFNGHKSLNFWSFCWSLIVPGHLSRTLHVEKCINWCHELYT